MLTKFQTSELLSLCSNMRSPDKLFFPESDWQANLFSSSEKQQRPTCLFHYSQVKPHQLLYRDCYTESPNTLYT